MNAREAFKKTIDIGDFVVQKYLADMTDEDLFVRPVAGCNHTAWQLGHLIESNRSILQSIAPDFDVELPEGFASRHSDDTCASDNPADFFPKQTYLDLLKKVNDAAKAALDASTDADLDAPSPEKWKAYFPSVGEVYSLIATHPMMHVGQWVCVRRVTGKPIVM